jgi:hypothetical protein
MPSAHASCALAQRGDCRKRRTNAAISSKQRTRSDAISPGSGGARPSHHERRYQMKKLILGAALAVLAASPVLAEGAYLPEAGYAPQHATRFDNIRAQAMPAQSGEVYVDGHYAGADPDANVRLQLQKDFTAVNNR